MIEQVGSPKSNLIPNLPFTFIIFHFAPLGRSALEWEEGHSSMNRSDFESLSSLPVAIGETLGGPFSHSESIFCLEKRVGGIPMIFDRLV